MTTPATPTSTITEATGNLDDELMSVAGVGLAIGVVVFALRKGWRLLKGFTS